MQSVYTPYDQVLYRNRTVEIGRFWVPVHEQNFENTGAIQNHILAIPTWSVEISYSQRESVVAEPTRAMCYNRGCDYRRRALNDRGDLSLWIAYDDDLLADAIGGSPEGPFRSRWAPLPRDAYLAARLIVANTTNEGGAVDPVTVEDQAWWLLGRCTESEYTMPRGNRRQHQAVDRARAFVAESYRERITLSDIARAACMSPYYLSRLFHRRTGIHLHRFLMELRLRDAVHDLLDSSRSLTEIAIDLGFASPSHFSSAFRDAFGMAPSRLRTHRTRPSFPAGIGR